MALCPLLTNFQSCLNSDTLLYCVHLNVLLVVDLSGYSRKLFPYLKHMHHYGGHQDLRRISTPVSQDLICNQGGELRAHVLSCRLCRRASRPPTTGTSSQCPDTTGLWSTDQLRLTPHFQDVNCFKAYITDLIFSINSCSLILFEKKKKSAWFRAGEISRQLDFSSGMRSAPPLSSSAGCLPGSHPHHLCWAAAGGEDIGIQSTPQIRLPPYADKISRISS